MKVMVLGGGGREHAICRGLKRSPEVTQLFCSPGNPGIAKIAECVALPAGEMEAVADFAAENGIDLVVVGPELPLCQGVADAVRARGIPVFGPSKAAARLEGSKEFSKQFMVRYGIPTAAYASFTEKGKALDYVRAEYAAGRGVVVKADGLAAGKGVIVASCLAEAEKAVEECFGGAFGEAGNVVVVEELLVGEEASILALADGNTVIPLVSSQDHKRLLDDDRGPNTGGMGAYSPAPVVTDALMREINETILQRFLQGVRAEKLDYRGIIYAGIMVTKDGPKVLEFNVRFGDPETEAILPRLESSLADALMKTALGKAADIEMKWSPKPSVCVVMASEGYPGSLRKGFEITGIEEAEKDGVIVFHAGTAEKDGVLVNAGGRVLVVTADGDTVTDAIAKAYAGVAKIHWTGVQYRRDIARRAVNRK